ncbi:MAG: hypothetical protein QM820_56970 [Minicystis sp.]
MTSLHPSFDNGIDAGEIGLPCRGCLDAPLRDVLVTFAADSTGVRA